MTTSDYNRFQRVSRPEPISDPDLQAVDALLTAAGERWNQLYPPVEHANQYLDALVTQEHSGMLHEQSEAMRSLLPQKLSHGERLIMKPTWHSTSIGIVLTLCLVAASVGVFVVLSHHQHVPSAASTPLASPTPRAPLAMPPAIIDLAMVSDHEGWALQNLGDLVTTPTASNFGEQLWHIKNGTWTKVTPQGLVSPYNASLAMASPINGWLLTAPTNSAGHPITSVVYHYDGSAWQQTPLPQLQGSGTPVLDSIQAAPTGDTWLTGNYLDLTGKKELQSVQAPLNVLSCLPNCGHTLVLHWIQGKWTEVTVPSNVTISADGGSLGWFPDSAGDQMTLYHYQSGGWVKLPLGIAAWPNWVSMATPTDGWIGAYVATHPGTNDGENSWALYHFDGKTAQRIAQVDFQRCFGLTLVEAKAINPDEIWIPLVSEQDCGMETLSQLLHLEGSAATTTALPSPYVAVGVPVQSDTNGNAWLLVAQKPNNSAHALPYDDKHEAILRWNGNAWVPFAETQG